MSELKIQEFAAAKNEQAETKQDLVNSLEKSDMTIVSAEKESAESGQLRGKFRFFGPITLLYSCFYAFCMSAL